MIVERAKEEFDNKREMIKFLKEAGYRLYKPFGRGQPLWVGTHAIDITPLLHGRYLVKFCISSYT